jgi:hypothetical protein
MKLFPFVVVVLLLLTMVLLNARGGNLWRLVPFVLILAFVLFGFVRTYDAVVAIPLGTEPLQAYLDIENLADYFNFTRRLPGELAYYTELGRNAAVSYAWESIQEDPMTLLFGLGIGARGESRTLGTAGVGLRRGDLGLTTGTSLLVMMQELGVMGLLALGGFILWIVLALRRDIQKYPDSPVTELRYGLMLFSLLWPLWLWYGTVWIFRVPMLIYWVALGYVLGEPRKVASRVEPARAGKPAMRFGREPTP